MLGRLRWAFLGTLACLVILLGLATQQGALLALAIPLVVFLAAGFYLSLREPQLRVERTVSAARAQAHEEISVRVEIQNTGPSIEEIQITDSIPSCVRVVHGRPTLTATLKSNAKLSLEYTVRGRRGFAQWHDLVVVVRDHLGLWRRAVKIPCSGYLFILPTFPRLLEVEVRPRRTRVYSGTVRTRLGGPGVEFFGVREYYPGDAMKHLNWKATARRGEPITNEFEQERVADIGMILDARDRTDVRVGGPSLFEHSVAAASSLADYFISRGNRVGLLIYGSHIDWTYPGFGKMQREKLLQALARAELSDRAVFEDLENIPTRLFPSGSQLVLVSPLVEDDVPILLQLRAVYHVIVVSPNPVLFEQAQLPPSASLALASRLATFKRALTLGQLREAGIRVVDWDVRADLPIPVEEALGRHTLKQVHTLRS
jgi:uncharacterized protein (DUF58 family)